MAHDMVEVVNTKMSQHLLSFIYHFTATALLLLINKAGWDRTRSHDNLCGISNYFKVGCHGSSGTNLTLNLRVDNAQ